MPHPSARSRQFARAAVVLASLWILTGAVFKLGWGTPNHLPIPVREEVLASVDPGLKLHLAIAIELGVVVLGLLAPSFGWILVTGCMSVFVLILWRLLALGEASCGCFGSKVTMSPEMMLAIDAPLLLLLVASAPWSALRGTRRAPLAVLLLLIAAGAAAPWIVIDDEGSGSAIASRGASGGATPISPPVAPASAPGTAATGSEPPGSARAATPAGTPIGAPGGSHEGHDHAVPSAAPGAAEGAAVGSAEIAEPTAPVMPRFVSLDPLRQEWVGKHVRDTDLARWLDVGAFPDEGEWILFSYTCDHCRDHLAKIDEGFAERPRTIVLVHVPNEADESERVVQILPPHFEPVAELPQGTDWVVQTPWTLELAGGIVTRAYLEDGAKLDSAKKKP